MSDQKDKDRAAIAILSMATLMGGFDGFSDLIRKNARNRADEETLRSDLEAVSGDAQTVLGRQVPKRPRPTQKRPRKRQRRR